MTSTVELLGVKAIQVFSPDLPPGDAMAREIRRRLAPEASGADADAYLVVSVSSTSGVRPRTYPIRVRFPVQTSQGLRP